MASFRCSQVFEKPFRGQEASERLITFFPATLLRVVRRGCFAVQGLATAAFAIFQPLLASSQSVTMVL